MSTIFSFRSIENKHGLYRGKAWTKKFCEFLRELAMKIINFKNKKIKLLTKEQHELHENAKICYICKDKIYCKVRDLSHYTGEYKGAARVIQNIACLKEFL